MHKKNSKNGAKSRFLGVKSRFRGVKSLNICAKCRTNQRFTPLVMRSTRGEKIKRFGESKKPRKMACLSHFSGF